MRQPRKINWALSEVYPYAHPEPDFGNPFELLVATVLSAQTTDLRVNQTTPALFARYPTPEAQSLIGLSTALRDSFGGEVPGRLEDLVTLPGVGRKTANIVLGNAFASHA